MTKQNGFLALRATGVRFLSSGDESAFFAWLKGIGFVNQVKGQGTTLFISIDESLIDEGGVRELLALFRRYDVDMAQLIVFDRDEFADWFRDDRSYWHPYVFG
ncbi:hypothetical protein PIN31115_01523 [Pandoraea iniqua]|uniref:Uncharacterized protein n=1 Tax=Pandoraea iniqua TaxID=2508288 RepID=A0A5E4TUF9_9BURK|nr:hypothetical protein [Pandoraea iniqua]VVD89579.1 hypothetical protein PIN31115_01523 [Pandoraea iniqua]